MSTAHMIALGLLPIAVISLTTFAVLSRRGRDVIFFGMIIGLLLSERLDVNFLGEAWYRGTTRGILVSAFEVLAFALLVGCRFGRRDESRMWYWPASFGFMLLYFAYSVISVLSTTPKMFGAFELSKMAGAMLIFLASASYIRGKREWGILLVALCCAVGAEGIWSVKQRIFTHLDRAAGTLDHANSLSTYFCMVTPVVIAAIFAEWPHWMRWLCGFAALSAGVGEILTFSRLGIPLFLMVSLATVVLAGRVRINRTSVITGFLMAATFAVLVAGSWNIIKARYAEATFHEEYFDAKVDGRGVYLRLAATIVSDHPFGLGLNNWSWYVSKSYGPDLGYRFSDYEWLLGVYGKDKDVFADSYLAAPAHNLLALTLGELGFLGLFLFAVLWARWFSITLPFLLDRRGDPRRALAMGLLCGIAGLFGHCITEWVFRQTPINFTFYIMLGALAAVSHHRKKEKEEEKENLRWRAYLREQRTLVQQPGGSAIAAGV